MLRSFFDQRRSRLCQRVDVRRLHQLLPASLAVPALGAAAWTVSSSFTVLAVCGQGRLRYVAHDASKGPATTVCFMLITAALFAAVCRYLQAHNFGALPSICVFEGPQVKFPVSVSPEAAMDALHQSAACVTF